MYDVLLKNGRIVDGCGNPWYKADVGIKDGRVVRIGDLREAEAAEIVDVSGQVVAPGFIDIHCHSDVLSLKEPREPGKILQGVTTEVVGNCGNSGNSTEPHVHAQLMDRASLWTGQGVPMAFRAISLDDQPEPIDGLPRNNQHMTAI